MKTSLSYRIILFKLKGHTTWRFTTDGAFQQMDKKNVTDTKIFEIDRLSGDIMAIPEKKQKNPGME